MHACVCASGRRASGQALLCALADHPLPLACAPPSQLTSNVDTGVISALMQPDGKRMVGLLLESVEVR